MIRQSRLPIDTEWRVKIRPTQRSFIGEVPALPGTARLVLIGCWSIATVVLIGCAEDKPASSDPADRFDALVSEASELLSPFIWLHGVEAPRPDKERILRAIALYDEALSIYPNRWQAFFLQGKGWQALGRYDRAYMNFKRAHGLAPDDVSVTKEYIIEASRLRRTGEALRVSRRAVETFPDDVGIQANHALILMFAGEMEAAEKQARQALSMSPGDKVTERVLADILAVRSGKRPHPNSVDDLGGF